MVVQVKIKRLRIVLAVSRGLDSVQYQLKGIPASAEVTWMPVQNPEKCKSRMGAEQSPVQLYQWRGMKRCEMGPEQGGIHRWQIPSPHS